jgi:hypothetical protein
MTKLINKLTEEEVTAFRWGGTMRSIHGIFPIENALEPTSIDRAAKIVTIITGKGELVAHDGDWLVKDKTGAVQVKTHEAMQAEYKSPNLIQMPVKRRAE